VQPGPLRKLSTPVTSARWRRFTFLHTTGERLLRACDLKDLTVPRSAVHDRLWRLLRARQAQQMPGGSRRRSDPTQFRPQLVPAPGLALAAVQMPRRESLNPSRRQAFGLIRAPLRPVKSSLSEHPPVSRLSWDCDQSEARLANALSGTWLTILAT
jgi:hypothetical protein